MTDSTSAASAAGQREADDRRLAGLFCRVAVGYWQGPTAIQAWLLTLALGAAVLFGIAGNVGVSMWNRWFFDALEDKDAGSAGWALLAFLGLAVAITAMSVCDVL